MATFPPRHANWRRVLDCIAPQVDRVSVVFNEMTALPDLLADYLNVEGIIPHKDLKDTGKFLPQAAPDDWVFTIDDDILYPPDYVKRSITALESTKLVRVVGGYHGSIYTKPRYLRSRIIRRLLNRDPNYIVNRRRIYGFSAELDQSLCVDQLGTGTVFMRGRDVPPFDVMQNAPQFVDVMAAHYWFQQGIQPICLAREKDWMRPMHEEKSIGSINVNFTKKAPKVVADIIHQFAYKNARTGQAV